MIAIPFRSFAPALVLGAALAVVCAGGVLAQTAPNTLVTNTINLSYNSGGSTPTVTLTDAASVQFRVDRRVDLTVTAQTAGGELIAVPGQAGGLAADQVFLRFQMQNNGNDTQGFIFEVAQSGSIGATGLTYSATVTADPGRWYVLVGPNADGSGAAVYDVSTAPNAGNRAPGESHYLFVIANVPIGAVDGEFDDFVVTATATDASTATPVVQDRTQGLMGVNTVFADAATTSTRTGSPFDPTIDAPLDGRDTDETRLLINAPVITATKSVVVLDELLPGSTFNCATGGAATGAPLAAIPGACVEYTITVTNAASASSAAANITVTDAIPANTTYAGNTAGDFTIGTTGTPVTSVTATLPTLPAGESRAFRIRVTVN
jgi:uncharacterized repeat protein (TIGR01451 family)